MPPERMGSSKEELFLEQLFRTERKGLLRYANATLRKYGASTISISGRAEDVVQEAFFVAWVRLDDVMKSEDPKGWLYKAVQNKAHEALREDRTWIKHLLMATLNYKGSINLMEPPVDWLNWMTREDYQLLVKLYLYGYTYTELCEELGLKKSTLAMRIFRIKEHFKKNFDFHVNF